MRYIEARRPGAQDDVQGTNDAIPNFRAARPGDNLGLTTGRLLSIPERPGVEPAVFETPEYHAQRGLAVVKASALYARGGTGQDVTVALIDSGLSTGLKEFEGRLSDPEFDYVENRPGTVDRVGHGTQMAGVLAANKDDQGIHGIAFNARLIPFRFGDDNEPFFFDSEIAQSWQSGFDKGALAALQSRYPQLSPQQVREHLLATTNRTGIYANSEAYGRGLMDLEAASRRAPGTMVD